MKLKIYSDGKPLYSERHPRKPSSFLGERLDLIIWSIIHFFIRPKLSEDNFEQIMIDKARNEALDALQLKAFPPIYFERKKDSKRKKILVKCTLEVPIEVPEEKDNPGYSVIFDIEENHCPGTGIVGVAIDEAIKEGDKNGYCWACRFNGKCEIA